MKTVTASRIDQSVKKVLVRESKKLDRTESWIINDALKEYFQKRKLLK